MSTLTQLHLSLVVITFHGSRSESLDVAPISTLTSLTPDLESLNIKKNCVVPIHPLIHQFNKTYLTLKDIQHIYINITVILFNSLISGGGVSMIYSVL